MDSPWNKFAETEPASVPGMGVEPVEKRRIRRAACLHSQDVAQFDHGRASLDACARRHCTDFELHSRNYAAPEDESSAWAVGHSEASASVMSVVDLPPRDYCAVEFLGLTTSDFDSLESHLELESATDVVGPHFDAADKLGIVLEYTSTGHRHLLATVKALPVLILGENWQVRHHSWRYQAAGLFSWHKMTVQGSCWLGRESGRSP